MEVFRQQEGASRLEQKKVTSKPKLKTQPIRSREDAVKLMAPTRDVQDFIEDRQRSALVGWLRYFENHRRQGYKHYYAFAQLTPAQIKQPYGIQFPKCPLRFIATYVGADNDSIVSVSIKQLISWLNSEILALGTEASRMTHNKEGVM